MLHVAQEDHSNFATAWSLQESRLRGEELPKDCRDPRLLRYGQVGRLGRQVERLFEKVGRSNCLVIVFDDIVADTLNVYRHVLDFS